MWKDAEFARQLIVGANPMSIHWAKEGTLPASFNYAAIKNCTTEKLRKSGRLFERQLTANLTPI